MKLEDFKKNMTECMDWITEGEIECFSLVISNAKHIPHPDDDPYGCLHERIFWLACDGINTQACEQSKNYPSYEILVTRDVKSGNKVEFRTDYDTDYRTSALYRSECKGGKNDA